DVDLVRQATFDFAGFADSGTTLTLVDSELNQPDDYWNDYRLKMMSGSNFGEERTVSDFDAASDTITVSSDFTNPIANSDKYVLQHETRLIKRIWTWTSDTAIFFASAAGEIWGYSGGRTLTNFGSLAADVWNVSTRRLTDKTLTGGGQLATETYIDTATSTLAIEINENETLINNLNTITAQEVWEYAARTLTDYSTSTIASSTAEEVWNIATSGLDTTGSVGKLVVDNIDTTISSRGTSDLTAGDVWAASTRTLSDYATSTIALAIWDNAQRTLTSYGNDITAADVWNTLSATLTTENSIGKQLTDNVDATITSRASQASVTALNDISATDVWAAATRTLTDYSTSSIAAATAEEVWGVATSTLTGMGTAGKHFVDNIDTTISSRGTSDLTAGDVWAAATRTLTDYSTSSIALAVWDNAQRTLTSYGNDIEAEDVWHVLSSALDTTDSIGLQLATNVDTTISSRSTLTAADVWAYSNRSLTSFGTLVADIWSSATRRLTDKTLTGGGQLATETYIDTATSTLAIEINENETLINNLDSDISALTATTTLILNKWDTYNAADIIAYVDEVEASLGASADATTTDTIFGRVNLLQEKWGTQTAQAIYDKANTTLATVQDLQTELGYNGTSTTAYADMQLVKAYSDDLEGYVGTPSDDSSANTLFGKIKDVREKLDQLDTLETKLDALDSIIDSIRASQQLDYTVELSDVGEVSTTKTYRAKLTILDYEDNPINSSTTPSIIIYDALRATADTGNMTELSTGVYEYTYVVLSDASGGLWESVVSVDLGGASTLILNDYWEVEGAPAQVIINSISDVIIPSISANVTISNEGNSDYEYQYEWCVVTSQDNECGGDDDVDYASAAKYLEVDEDWTTELGLTVPNNGDYWFKVVVYYGTETSGASRMFSATGGEEEEEEETPGGGGGSSNSTASLSDVYNKLLEVQTEFGYHGTSRNIYEDLSNIRYNLGILPDQLGDPLYTILSGVSADIESIGGTAGYNLDDIYRISQTDSSDLKYIVNKTSELKAVIDVNKSLISAVANKPIIQTWFTEGSIVLNILVINPPDASSRMVTVKEYLPKEIKSEHIIEIEEGLQLEYDSNLDNYFVTGEIKLEANERKVFKIKTEDVFKISEDELSSLKGQAETLMLPLIDTSYFAQASILKSEIDADLQSISRMQIEGTANIEKRISVYRDNQKDLQKVQENIEALKKIASEVSGKSMMLGNLFGVSTTMTWAIILIVIVGISILMILLYAILAKNRALEYHVAGGKKLKAPPMIDVKKQTKKIKGGLITYFLPPFGKPVVYFQQLMKWVKILVIIGILVMLVIIGISFSWFDSLI
ncbi:hypothetical protein K8R42_03250, partial [bacterium]|nr:hypothetical protein [bacterium]